MSDDYLLEVRGLKTHFFTDAGVVKAVDGVDFKVKRGEIFGLVGESGCGKSVTAFSILRLVRPPGRIIEGAVIFDGNSLMDLTEKKMRDLRGRHISMIFQQPQASLNPVFNIGSQVAEVIQIHQEKDKADAWKQAVDLLHLVGIPDPEKRAKSYPHEISGGQAQRVMISTALALDPHLLIADEPTTALDVTIQAQILELIEELTQHSNTAVILITHDLGVIAEMCDRVAIMYAGQLVERAQVETLFDQPLHPYTQGLMASMPILGDVRDRLKAIPGTVPDLVDLPPGCKFAPRCDARVKWGLQICTEVEPDEFWVGSDRSARCWLYMSSGDHKAALEITETGIVEKRPASHQKDG